MKYLRVFLLALALPLLLLAAFNAAIDPYGVLGAPLRPGINDVKYLGNDRFVKPLQILRLSPQVVYFGTSRVMIGLDPADIPERRIFNFGIPALTIAELDVYARHVLAATPAKLLVIGLDYISFDDTAPARPGFDPDLSGPLALWKALPRLLLSAETTLKSRSVMRNSRQGEVQSYHPDGFFEATGIGADAVSARYYARVVAHKGPAQQSLARLDALLGEAGRRGIEVVAFLPPLHATLIEALRLQGEAATHEAWLRRLVALCEIRGVPLWDFAGYNRETTIAMGESGRTFINGGHPSPRLGRLIQQSLLRGQSVPGFGERLTSVGLDDYLTRQKAARDVWVKAQPADFDTVRRVMRISP